MNALHPGRLAVAGALALAVLAGCLMTGAIAATTIARLSLDFKFEGPSAPFLLALDKGYYKTEGLDLTIDPAADSLESITRVASGSYEIGFGDINALIKYVHPEVPIKAVFMVYNRPPFAVIGRKSRGIERPKDLEGKKLGAPPADSAYAQWPIFVQANGIDASKVTIENVSFPVREPMLAAGQVDAVTGFSFSSFVNLKDRGVAPDDITVLMMADYGVSLYGNAIFVSPKFLSENPDAVKRFLRAFLKGLKETVKSPATAVESVLRRNDAAKKTIELERLNMALRDNIVTPEVKATGYGGIDTVRFEKAIDQIGTAYKWKTGKPKPDDIFDASYLPPAADRKAN